MKRLIKHKKVIITMIIVVFIFGLTGNLVSAETRKEPSFDITMSVNPKQAEVGQDINVTGTIKPNDFELQEKEKEIVLVLDTSGSMNESIYVPYYNNNYQRCTGNEEKYCVNHNSRYCQECNLDYRWHRWYREWYCNTHSQWTNEYDKANKPSVCNPYYLHDWRYDYCPYHAVEGIHTGSIESTKIAELKKAAKAFVDKMQDVSNLKIAIVEFNRSATIKNGGFLNANNERLYKSIERLGANEGTNTGDGLRKAAYLLSQQGSKDANKTIVLMSDGVPTYYSLDGNGYYYEELNDQNTDVGGPGNGYNDYTIEYAKLMGSKVKANNAYSIGYGLGDENSANNKILKGIHSSMSGNDEAFYASSDGAIEGIFSAIADKIKESYSLTKVELDTKISMDDFEISLPSDSNCKLDNEKVIIPDIVYKKQGNSNLYKADPIKFSYIIKGKKTGNYSLFKDNNAGYIKLTYYDGESKKEIPVKCDDVIYIVEKIGCKTEIEVSDSAGVINDTDKYFNGTAKLNESNNRYELAVKNNDTDKEYKLFGSAKASIKGEYPEVKDGETRVLQYQFVEKNNNDKSTEDIKSVKPDENQWKDINLDYETYNPDVGEEGKLTVRPYNVDHMKTKYEQSRWENRQEVFKNPSDSIERKSASTAQNISEYVSAVSVGQDYKLSASTIFTENIKFDDTKQMETLASNYPQSIRERVKGLSAEYKEAYKYWGYFSPKESGYYLLGILSDDGSIGTITVKGEPIVFSESFKVQSDTFTANSRLIYLEKGKYYPLNLEYFNWGGGAVFKMMYKNYGQDEPNIQKIQEDINVGSKRRGYGFYSVSEKQLYSSNSNEPGESSTGKFTGIQGVPFPNKVGRYYIAYRVGIKDSENNIKIIDEQGVYGPFSISENVSLIREVIDNQKVDDYSEELGYIPHRVSLKYTIKPNDIEAREIYKGKDESYAEKLFISKYSITDNLIKGIGITSKSGDLLNSASNGIDGSVSKISSKDSTKINIDIRNNNSQTLKSYIYNDLIKSKGWYNEEMKQLYDNRSIESVADEIASNTAKDVDIIYTLDKKDNTYKAEPISFETEILCDAEKSYELKRESTLSNYSDVIIRAIDRKLEVQNHVNDDGVINSVNYGKVIEHGVYINNESGLLTPEDEQLRLAPGVPISAGVIVDAVGKCQLKIDEVSSNKPKGDINLSDTKVYKLDENNKIVSQVSEGLIIDDTKKEISLDGNDVKGRYLILYTYDSKIDAKGDLELRASTLGDREGKILKVNFDSKGLPDLF